MANKAMRFGDKTATQHLRDAEKYLGEKKVNERVRQLMLEECFAGKMKEKRSIKLEGLRYYYVDCKLPSDFFEEGKFSNTKLGKIYAPFAKEMAANCHLMDNTEMSEFIKLNRYNRNAFAVYTLKGDIPICLFIRRPDFSQSRVIYIGIGNGTCEFTVLNIKTGATVAADFLETVKDWQENYETYKEEIDKSLLFAERKDKIAIVQEMTNLAMVKMRMKKEGLTYAVEDSKKYTTLFIRLTDENFVCTFLSFVISHDNFQEELEDAVKTAHTIMDIVDPKHVKIDRDILDIEWETGV